MENFELKIAMRLVKEDGTFGKNENINSDWENVWFVEYAEYQFIVDQNENIIDLGIAQLHANSMMAEWVPADCIDPEIEIYGSFLKKLVEIVEFVQDNQYSDGRIKEKHNPVAITMLALELELPLTVKQSNIIWNIIN